MSEDDGALWVLGQEPLLATSTQTWSFLQAIAPWATDGVSAVFPVMTPDCLLPFAPAYDPALPIVVMPDSYLYSRAGGAVHHASDLLAPYGSIIRAIVGGTVTSVGWNALGGYTVTLTSTKPGYPGMTAYYAHMLSPAKVRKGDLVSAGQVLGFVGDTGGRAGNLLGARNAGPPHLHLGIRISPAGGGPSRLANPYSLLLSLSKPLSTDKAHHPGIFTRANLSKQPMWCRTDGTRLDRLRDRAAISDAVVLAGPDTVFVR